ncbi:hypothetical protein NC651_031138 [Populus alba x Populus x berolinensis]|nr:hypothetical protein NC651_031138 [Populus alba x Populus x berolinensis]
MVLHFYVSNLFCYCSVIFLYCLIFLILGVIMLSVASTLSRSLVFYYSSTMAIGINLVILVVLFQVIIYRRIELLTGDGASANRSKELAFNFHVGLGTFLFRYLPGLLHSILMEMGISKDMHYPYCRRLDGTLTLSSRDRAVKDLNTDPKVTVMLMSLKAGNLGLNMVAACHEFLLDLWWNPTTEDQAVDRAHRIAHTCPVTEKSQSGGSATRLTVEDLKYLFMF